MRSALAALALLATWPASAEPTTVFIPGRQWTLEFDIGLVAQYQARTAGRQFQYAASTASTSGSPRAMLTFFLEDESSDSQRACHAAFWRKASANPLIDKASVKHKSFDGYEQVLYRLTNGQQHGNFYFVKDRSCADVHISLSAPMPQAEEAVAGFGRTLKW